MIETVTNVDEKHILQFNMYVAKKKIWFPIAVMIFLIIVGVATLFAPSVNKIGGIFLMCLGLLMPLIYWGVIVFLVKRNVKNSPILKNGLVQTIRYEDKIYISESNKYVVSNNMEYAWQTIVKVVETRESFYFYISNNQAYIVGKDCFTAGTSDDLHKLLTEKIEKKNFIYKQKQAKK